MTVKHARPTSPHLQVYKLPLTGLISISHRITGIFLSAGLLLLVALLYALSLGAEGYSALQLILNYWLIKILYWGFIFALSFHLCHGVRHLYWDVGEGFDANSLTHLAIIELLLATALTLGVWIFI